jgi:uncharacterized paraquat-inducible protein A
MAKLPGWSFMLVGAIVVGYSIFISSRVEKSLSFFLWVGAALIAWGVLREVRTRWKKPEPKTHPEPPKQEPERPVVHGAHAQTHQHVRPHQHPSHPHEPTHKRCPRCHQANFFRARFCHQCGFGFQ